MNGNRQRRSRSAAPVEKKSRYSQRNLAQSGLASVNRVCHFLRWVGKSKQTRVSNASDAHEVLARFGQVASPPYEKCVFAACPPDKISLQENDDVCILGKLHDWKNRMISRRIFLVAAALALLIERGESASFFGSTFPTVGKRLCSAHALQSADRPL
jgi:hypothetical protein